MHSLSVWEKETWYAPQDILIAGAGLMGLWTALELKKRRPELRITILERNTTPLGASTRNAGFACYGSPTELLHNARTMGTDAMLDIVEMRYKGIEKIKNNFTAGTIDYDPCGGYECITQAYKGWDGLDDRIDWLNNELKTVTGQTRSFERTDTKLSSLGLTGFDALFENTAEASLHSGKLVRALTAKVKEAGISVLYGTQISGWDGENNQVQIQTKDGLRFQAQQLVICTNAFAGDLLPDIPVIPGRGQIIVTTPIPGLAMNGTFHFDEGFYYWRNLGNRILLGGARNTALEEENTTDFSGSGGIRSALESFLRQHLNPVYQYQTDYHWSGIMAFTDDGRPFTQWLGNNVFTSVACNGMGVALTPVIAEKNAAALLSRF